MRWRTTCKVAGRSWRRARWESRCKRLRDKENIGHLFVCSCARQWKENWPTTAAAELLMLQGIIASRLDAVLLGSVWKHRHILHHWWTYMDLLLFAVTTLRTSWLWNVRLELQYFLVAINSMQPCLIDNEIDYHTIFSHLHKNLLLREFRMLSSYLFRLITV